MKINWLKNVDIFKIDYVNRPAIDKHFIAIKMMDYKSVIPFRKTKTLPETTIWDAGIEKKKAEPKDLKVMCTWYDSKDADNKGSYKLPHHKYGGGYPVVWNAVHAAMGALMGARGGVILPDSDRKGVYNHLAKHYKQFDKDVPEFKEVNELDKSFIDKIANKIKNKLGLVETKIGRVLSKTNETKLLSAANDMIKAGNTIKSVLDSLNKNLKKEGNEMEEKEVKKIVEKAIEEKMGTFQKAIEDKLEELLKKEVNDDEDAEDEEEEDNEDDDENDDEDDDSDDEEDSDEDEEDEEEEDIKKSKKNVSKKKISKKSKKDKLLTGISDIVEKKFKEVKSEVDKIKKELKIKPESDKKKVDKKDSGDNDDEVDFTGVFGIKDI